MSNEYEIERRCSFEKKPGIIQLSQTHLVWTPDSAADGIELKIAFTSIRQYQVSKEGSAKKAMIRLTCNDRDAKITFDFAKDFTNRDAVRDALNELRERGANALASARKTSDPTNSDTSGTNVSKPESKRTPIEPVKRVPPEEMAWRQALLVRKEVRKLHMKVVVSGAVSDQVFWKAMRYRYGKDGQMKSYKGLDDEEDENDERKRQSERGVPSDAYAAEVKCGVDISKWESIIPTAVQRHLVFMEHPSVARARAAKVPNEMSEEQFWEMFQASSMVGRRGRARISKTDTSRMAEADAIFAPFQAKEQEVAEEEQAKKIRGLSKDIDIDRFDDHRMQHVMEGHAAGGDAPRPMKEQKHSKSAISSSLRLMKHLNRHGQLIVDGEQGTVHNWIEDGVKGRPLEDLEEEQERKFARLDVAENRQERTSGVGETKQYENGIESSQLKEMVVEISNWNVDLSRYNSEIYGNGSTLSKLLTRMKP